MVRIRHELREDSPVFSHSLYQDVKSSLSAIDQRILALQDKKAELFARQTAKLEAMLESDPSHSLSRLPSLRNVLNDQLRYWDSRLERLYADREKILSHQISLSQKIEPHHNHQQDQLNQLYQAHSKLMMIMHQHHTDSYFSLSKLFVKTSQSFLENIVMAPVRFMGAYFFPNNRKDNTSSSQLATEQRQKILLLESELNLKVTSKPMITQ